MIITMILYCFVGFILFSLSNKKHVKLIDEEMNLSVKQKTAYHLIGWMFLLIGTWPAISIWQTEIGLMVWVCMLQLSSLLVAMMLTYLPHLYVLLGRVCLLPLTLMIRKKVEL